MLTITCRLILLLFLVNFYSIKAEIVINEIMPAPLDGEPEWIELFNFSSADFFCESCSISDFSSTRKVSDFVIKSNQYAIIVKDTNLLKSYYMLPNDVVLIQSAFPALNNTTDAVVLKNSANEILDSVYYDLKWGEKGLSLERIDFSIKAINSANWAKSTSANGATPGELNSNAIINYDLYCEYIKIANDYQNIELRIIDNGRLKSEHFEINLFISLPNIEEYKHIFSSKLSFFSEKDTLIFLPLEILKSNISHSGIVKIKSVLQSDSDQRSQNDTTISSIYIRLEEPNIRINEFMYDVSDEFAEYIEIWNGGEDSLLMDNFVIWDAAGSLTKGNIPIVSNSFVIAPGGYGVLVWDSVFFNKFPELIEKSNVYFYKSSFNLNLAGDLIVLADAGGKIYDSLTYSNQWHNKSVNETKNRSLEKINTSLDSFNPDNWSTSTDIIGGTPGRENSLYSNPTKDGDISISPNPFAPSRGGADANAVINYEIPFMQAYINASIYDINGFKQFEIANNRYSGALGSLVWNGTNQDGYIVQIGQYILILESTDSVTGSVHTQKALIVVGN